MHRRTVFTAITTLTLPLLLAAGPANAAPPETHVEVTEATTTWGYVWGTSDQLPGNVHQIFLSAGHYGEQSADHLMIFSYQCDPGERPDADTEEEWCEDLGGIFAVSEDLDWTIAPDGTSASISGTATLAPSEGEAGSETTVAVDVVMSTPTVGYESGGPYRYRDEDGRLVRGTHSSRQMVGEANGTIAGMDLDGAYADVEHTTNTYRVLGKARR